MTLPIRADFLGLDCAYGALFFRAKHGETVSLKAAEAQAAGQRWGCLFCRFLDIAVEAGHCAKQLDPNSPATGTMPGIRAALLFVLLTAALWSLPLVAWHMLLAVLP